jgi:hypothetical protein
MKTVCPDCLRDPQRWTRLSSLVTFQFKVAKVLPPDDPITVPVLRLLMAVDDLRRAQIQLVEAHDRLDLAPAVEKYRAIGDLLYGIRLLLSHLHEGGTALKTLDIEAKKRVDQLLKGNAAAMASLKAARAFFNARDYKKSFVSQVRNVIGFHYRDEDVRALVNAEIKQDTLLESTAAQVGGLARMADGLVVAMINRLDKGGVVPNEEQSTEFSKALDVAGHLVTLVDHLFDRLMARCPDALAEHHEVVLEIPSAVWRAREAVDAARRKVKAERAATN